MSNPGAQATVLVQLLERMRGGVRAAHDELVRTFQTRLGQLARRMLQRHPSVGRWVEVEDILQVSLLRLLRVLESVTPTSTRAFFGLATEQMRRDYWTWAGISTGRRHRRKPRQRARPPWKQPAGVRPTGSR